MSEANSGGVFSNVDFIPSTIELTGSLSASLTSDEEIDSYIENVRKQMKQYLKGSDGIQIQ